MLLRDGFFAVGLAPLALQCRLWLGMIARRRRAFVLRLFQYQLISFVIVVLCGLAGCEASPVPVGTGSEKIIHVADLPDVPQNRLETGEYFDVGYVYQPVYLFFLPVWNRHGRWAGHLDAAGRYAALDEAALRERARAAGVVLPERPPLPGWDAYGGKLAALTVVVALALFFAWGRVFGPRPEE